MKPLFLTLCLFVYSLSAKAVYVNHEGIDDVLIVPYYSVNNALDTLVGITNTTEQGKAIKINIREGLNGYSALSYNVYLDGFDTWTFILVNHTSTQPGQEGQSSAILYSADDSCAPFLNKSGHEFVADELVDGPENLSRVRTGFIEIIEMGQLTGDVNSYVAQGNNGANNDSPPSCEAIEAAWQPGGIWDEASGGDISEDMLPGTGGLMAEANLINVAEGINFSIPVGALGGFFTEGTVSHRNPFDSSLSMDAAEPKATLINEDKSYNLTFDSGQDAVSAALMAETLVGTYALDSIVGGKSETVYVQPTRRFYVGEDLTSSLPPYNADLDVTNCSADNYGGTELDQMIFDRESRFEIINHNPGGGVTPPAPPGPAICGSVFVQEILLPGSPRGAITSISGSENHGFIFSPLDSVATENGFITTQFEDTRALVGNDAVSGEPVQLVGLPVLGLTLQQFTNANAGFGLLAQYGGTAKLKSKKRIIEQN